MDHVNQVELERLSKDNLVKNYNAKVTYINKLIQNPPLRNVLLKNSISEGLVNGNQGIIESFYRCRLTLL